MAEQDRGRRVDAGEGGIGERHDPVRRAEHHRGERDRIDPEVEQRAPAQLGREQAEVAVLGEPLPVIGAHGGDLAQRALREQPPDLHDPRQEAGPHRLHEEQALGAGGGDQLLRLGGVHRERLLDQHRLARAQREQRVRVVHRVRRADVDGVDLRVGDERLVARVPVGHAEALAELLRGLLPPRADRHHGAGVGQLEIGGERPRDQSRPDDAPAQHARQVTATRAPRTPATRATARSRPCSCPTA
jgi:hypothetical protein